MIICDDPYPREPQESSTYPDVDQMLVDLAPIFRAEKLRRELATSEWFRYLVEKRLAEKYIFGISKTVLSYAKE